jgi:hypothetical protein
MPAAAWQRLANASVDHSRDLGSNLGTDRKYFLILLVFHLNSNLNVEHY